MLFLARYTIALENVETAMAKRTRVELADDAFGARRRDERNVERIDQAP